MKAEITKILFFVFLISGLFIAANLQAFEGDRPLEESHSDDESLVEIKGLLIDRTLTRFGRDFYFTFALKMNAQYHDLEINFTVKERPTALSGSIISIYHFNRLIYKAALSPGRHQAEQKADEAMYAVRNYIVKWKTEKQFKDTFDVERSGL
ncbi:MAG: curli production assembly/transport protein CsgE [Psychromonas sp.]|nr:curli production assembly/transport protein CsgE [Psychromonas sp.]